LQFVDLGAQVRDYLEQRIAFKRGVGLHHPSPSDGAP
jgi:hypothetical protein